MSYHKIQESCDLYVRSMGKRLRVWEICTTDDEANERMAKDDRLAVVAVAGGLVLLAHKYDKGEPY